MIAPGTVRSSRALQQMLSRDGNVVLALLAALSILFTPLVMVHAVAGTAWATSDVCAPKGEKAPHSGSTACTMCCTTAHASALPEPVFSAPAPAPHFAVHPPTGSQLETARVGALRPHVRAPPALS
jgi:hypothetical protein